MIRAVADTHTVIWYLFNDSRLSRTARITIEEAAAVGNMIAFSSMTLAAISLNMPVISRDRAIQASRLRTVW